MKYILPFLLSLLFPVMAFAQESINPCAEGNADLSLCKTSTLPFGTAFGTIIQFLFVIAVILALGFLVYGGIRWITSGGDKGGVETARNTIIAAIVGLILVFLAYVILNLVLLFLTGKGLGEVTIPNLTGGTTGDTNDQDAACAIFDTKGTCNAAGCHWEEENSTPCSAF
ncbi:MAG: hypothetical protein HYV40_01435 [Candidatus Levybacteria bacterium]|nr:hypothetical protein [Candidatus Levybacteria bacterium]